MCCDAVIEAALLENFPAPDTQNRGTGEMHLASRRSRQRTHQKVVEGRSSMCAAALPLADDIVAFGNQIGGTPEVEVRECTTEIGHESLDIVTAATRCVQGIFQQHVRRGDLV